MVLHTVANELARIGDVLENNLIDSNNLETLTKFSIILHRCKSGNFLPSELVKWILDIVSCSLQAPIEKLKQNFSFSAALIPLIRGYTLVAPLLTFPLDRIDFFLLFHSWWVENLISKAPLC